MNAVCMYGTITISTSIRIIYMPIKKLKTNHPTLGSISFPPNLQNRTIVLILCVKKSLREFNFSRDQTAAEVEFNPRQA
jgi:hypothetical protein